MRLILISLVVLAGTLVASPRPTTECNSINDLRSTPKPSKGKRGFHPLRLLRGLGKAESEFAIRLSSLGIRRELEIPNSETLPRPLTETSTAMPPSTLGGSSR